MGNGDDNTPLALFKALQQAFGETIRERRGRPDLERFPISRLHNRS